MLILLGGAGLARAQEDDDDDELVGARMPTYFYLTADMTDQVNLDITEGRLRRLLPMIEKYRKTRPDLMATVLFSGADERGAPRAQTVRLISWTLRRTTSGAA